MSETERRGNEWGANGVRISDAIGTVGDEEAARGCGVALTIGVAACVGKGWRKRLAKGWEERFGELEIKQAEVGKTEGLIFFYAANGRADRGPKNRRRAPGQ